MHGNDGCSMTSQEGLRASGGSRWSHISYSQDGEEKGPRFSNFDSFVHFGFATLTTRRLVRTFRYNRALMHIRERSYIAAKKTRVHTHNLPPFREAQTGMHAKQFSCRWSSDQYPTKPLFKLPLRNIGEHEEYWRKGTQWGVCLLPLQRRRKRHCYLSESSGKKTAAVMIQESLF